MSVSSINRRPMVASPRQMAETVFHNLWDDLRTIGFHLLRWVSLVYPARCWRRLPHGVAYCAVWWGRWVVDVRGRELADINRKNAASTRKGGSAANTAEERHERRMAWHAIVSLLAVGAAGWASHTYWTTGRQALVVVAWVVVATWVGYLGRDREAPFLDEISRTRQPPITKTLVMDALARLGYSRLTRELEDEHGARALDVYAGRAPNGAGQVIEVDLPGGTTAAMVMAKREEFVTTFRRASSQIYLEEGPEHPGHLVVTVLDRPPVPGELAKGWKIPTEADVFEGVPVGRTVQGDSVSLRLVGSALLIGGVRGSGKTELIRNLVYGSALDDRTDYMVYELKGTGDLSCLRDRCVAFRQGDQPDDLAAAMAGLRWVHDVEMPRRKSLIARVHEADLARCPENRITPELAGADDVDLPVLYVVIDEFHALSEHPEYGPEFLTLGGYLARHARALGIVLVFGTQRPDADAIPGRFREQFDTRIGLRTMTKDNSNMILGDGLANRGYSCTDIGPDQPGLGWALAGTPDPVKFQAGHVTPADVVARLDHVMDGWVPSGHALGEADPAGHGVDTDDRRVIDLVLAVWSEAEQWVPTNTIAGRLRGDYPARFHGWTGGHVTRALGKHSLKSHDRRVDGQVLKCLNLDEVTAAAMTDRTTTEEPIR